MQVISSYAKVLIERVKHASGNTTHNFRRIECAMQRHLKCIGLAARPVNLLLEIPRIFDHDDFSPPEMDPEYQTALISAVIAARNLQNRAWQEAINSVSRTNQMRNFWAELNGLPAHQVRSGLGQPWSDLTLEREHEFLNFMTRVETDAEDACAYANGLAAFDHPATRRLANIYLPMIEAYDAGLLGYWIENDRVVAVARPIVSKMGGVLHCPDGPAVIWPSGTAHFFWRGTPVPEDWIVNRENVAAEDILSWGNMEQRRAGIEILGWDRILDQLATALIDKHMDPEIGTLIEVTLPKVGPTRYLRVACGTGRQFAICVPPWTRSAIEAQAWCSGQSVDEFRPPEIRT